MKTVWTALISALAVFAASGPSAADTSGDGIQVGNSFSARIGGTPPRIDIRFVYKNLSGHTLTFGPNGVFAGCRKDGVLCDFGHTARNQPLAEGGAFRFQASLPCVEGAEYNVWPAYHLDGHYGPYRWVDKTVVCRSGRSR